MILRFGCATHCDFTLFCESIIFECTATAPPVRAIAIFSCRKSKAELFRAQGKRLGLVFSTVNGLPSPGQAMQWSDEKRFFMKLITSGKIRGMDET